MCLCWEIFTSEWIECSKPPSLNINIVSTLNRRVFSPGVTPCLCSRWVTPGSLAWGGLKVVGGFPEWRDQKDHRDPEACRENRAPPACLASRALRWVAGSVHPFSVGTPSHSTRGRGRPLLGSVGSCPVVIPAAGSCHVCPFTLWQSPVYGSVYNCLFLSCRRGEHRQISTLSRCAWGSCKVNKS